MRRRPGQDHGTACPDGRPHDELAATVLAQLVIRILAAAIELHPLVPLAVPLLRGSTPRIELTLGECLLP